MTEPTNERNVCEAAQPQHNMALEKVELNSLSFLKLEPWDTFLPNTTVAAHHGFIEIFG